MATAQEQLAALQQQLTTTMREVQTLNAQVATLSTENARVQGENAALNASITPLVSAVPGIAAEVTNALKELKKEQSERSKVKGLIDVRGIGKPYSFEEKEDRYLGWSRKFENWLVASYGDEFRAVLTWAVDSETTITSTMVDDEFGAVSYTHLTLPTILLV